MLSVVRAMMELEISVEPACEQLSDRLGLLKRDRRLAGVG